MTQVISAEDRLKIAYARLTALERTVAGGEERHPTHPCCYCACQMKDYHKSCHKFCVLPRGKDKKIRTFTKTEDRFCKEFCDIKRKSAKH